jgi:CHAT domain-containing protein
MTQAPHKLDAYDVLTQLQLEADLVVPGACETGSGGHHNRQEEIVGLRRI